MTATLDEGISSAFLGTLFRNGLLGGFLYGAKSMDRDNQVHLKDLDEDAALRATIEGT